MLAYIDMGSGALILQWLIAAVIGASLMLRRYIALAFSALFIWKRKPPEATDQQEQEDSASSDC